MLKVKRKKTRCYPASRTTLTRVFCSRLNEKEEDSADVAAKVNAGAKQTANANRSKAERKRARKTQKKRRQQKKSHGVAAATYNTGHNPHRSGKRKIILDTGATYHLISRKILTPSELRTVRPAEEEVELNTANSKVWATTEVDVYVEELDATVSMYVLNRTPTVLGALKLCGERNLKFILNGDAPPVIINKKTGKRHVCEKLQDIPQTRSGAPGRPKPPCFPSNRSKLV